MKSIVAFIILILSVLPFCVIAQDSKTLAYKKRKNPTFTSSSAMTTFEMMASLLAPIKPAPSINTFIFDQKWQLLDHPYWPKKILNSINKVGKISIESHLILTNENKLISDYKIDWQIPHYTKWHFNAYKKSDLILTNPMSDFHDIDKLEGIKLNYNLTKKFSFSTGYYQQQAYLPFYDLALNHNKMKDYGIQLTVKFTF